jgi:hypothetical protein
LDFIFGQFEHDAQTGQKPNVQFEQNTLFELKSEPILEKALSGNLNQNIGIRAICCSRELVVCLDLQSKQSFSCLQCQCIQIYNYILHAIKVIILQVECLLV